MYSVLETMEQGGKVNFESVEDSAIDMINYASFLVAYMRGEIDGQEAGKDIFNRRLQGNEISGLIPSNFRMKDKDPSINLDANAFKIVPQQYMPTGRFEE